MRVLVVEDEKQIAGFVRKGLEEQGFKVDLSHNGDEGHELAKTHPYDVIVLDIMLPGLDGLEVCRRLRDSGRFAPVLFLTARDEQDDRIKGFVVGGDDYLTKPFSVDELVLRVAAILRRAPDGQPTEALVVDDLVLDPAGMEVRRGGTAIELSRTEFRLLHYLMTNAGIVVSKTQILLNVWEYDYAGGANVVELYIGYLRRKVDDGREPLIHTKRGAGYVLRRPQA